MIKVLHVTNDLYLMGGVQRLLVDLIELQHKEFQFSILLTRGNNEFESKLKELGVNIYLRRDLSFFQFIKLLNSTDIVHAHLFPSIYYALLSKSTKVITEHNPYYRRRDYKIIRAFEKIFFRSYSNIICISEGVKREFCKTLTWKTNNCIVINNGVDLSRFQLTPRSALENNIINIGMVGRLERQKDYKTLLIAISRLDAPCKLFIAGDGSRLEELQEYSAELGITDKVVFHGMVEDIPQFLESIDIYVQSSFWEGFGLAVVEAMASGLPCFATNVAGLNDIVAKENLFKVGDHTKLTNLLSTLISDKMSYRCMSEDSVMRANEYNIELCAEAHTKLYRKLSQ